MFFLLVSVCSGLVLVSGILSPAEAKLVSPNYRIPTEIISSGGGSGETEDFIYDNTIGQTAVEVSASQNYTALLGYYWGYYIDFPVSVNFDPDTLNLSSEGKFVTVYIELPDGYSPDEIDIRSVRLAGIDGNEITPVHCLLWPTGITDEDSDGQKELMMKFDRETIGQHLTCADAVVLSFTGELKTGDTFSGKDTIRVIDPPDPSRPTHCVGTPLVSHSPSFADATKPAKPGDTKTGIPSGVNTKVPDRKDEIRGVDGTNPGKSTEHKNIVDDRASNKPDDNRRSTDKDKTDDAPGFEVKFSKQLFPRELKFNNGGVPDGWLGSDSGILCMKDKYPEWSERNAVYKPRWSESNKIDIPRVQDSSGGTSDSSPIIYTYTTVIDAETGEVVWHSNFGNHSGRFKDMRAEYRNDLAFQKHAKDPGNWDNRLTVRNSPPAQEHKKERPDKNGAPETGNANPTQPNNPGNTDNNKEDMPDNVNDNKDNTDGKGNETSEGSENEKHSPDNSNNDTNADQQDNSNNTTDPDNPGNDKPDNPGNKK